MTEIEWAENIKELINSFLHNTNFVATTASKLIYANEIVKYSGEGNSAEPEYNAMSYETDILIRENLSQLEWIPRVVIETKIDSVTTHDAITYSNKSKAHKSVHPFLRYGIFIGNHSNKQIPGRLIRHGEDFDFMMASAGYELNIIEQKTLRKIIELEINASQSLTNLVFNTRAKDRHRAFALHRPLVIYDTH